MWFFAPGYVAYRLILGQPKPVLIQVRCKGLFGGGFGADAERPWLAYQSGCYFRHPVGQRRIPFDNVTGRIVKGDRTARR
jgi:hypothetical protein